MTGQDRLAALFEEHRAHLGAVARRVLGSSTDAEDAVQETWLRASRSDLDAIANLGGWLTTVVSRVALDMLRARATRREVPDGEPTATVAAEAGPEDEAVLTDSIGTALLVVTDTLTPSERVAFVLHDTFAVSFDDIGAILERTPTAAKQLAHRARRKVQDPAAQVHGDARGRAGQRQVVEAFLAASRDGRLDVLVELLHPDVVLQADSAAVAMGSPARLQGAAAVAALFSGRARAARTALLDGRAGLVWSVGGRPKVAWTFDVIGGRVVGMDMVADPAALDALNMEDMG